VGTAGGAIGTASAHGRTVVGLVAWHCVWGGAPGPGELRTPRPNRVKILFTKMGSEGDLIGSANSIQINPSLHGMRASFCCCAAWLLVKTLYSGYGRLSSPNS